MKKILCWLGLIGSLGASGAWAGGHPDVIGKIDALDGTVAVVRAGTPLKASLVDTGFALENNDQVKVSANGWADIALDTGTGIRAHLHLKASTVVLLDLSSLVSSGQTGALDLLVGSLSLKVQKLTGANQLDVHTETAAMGVRGTEFSVDTEVDGSALLTTTEGRVQLTPDHGAVRYSVPGTAVRTQGEENSRWVEEKVTDPQAFIEAWHQERQKAFLARRDVILGRLADQYEDLSRRFDRAYHRLDENSKLWETWSKEEAQGTRGPGLQDAALRARVHADLVEVRRLSWNLERIHGRLGWIETRMGPKAFAEVPVKLRSGSWGDFVKSWHAQRDDLEKRLAQVHYRVKLFALRHGRLERVEHPFTKEERR